MRDRSYARLTPVEQHREALGRRQEIAGREVAVLETVSEVVLQKLADNVA